MKRILIPALLLLASTALVAAEKTATALTPTEQKIDTRIRESLPVCKDQKITKSELNQKLPTGFVGNIVKVDSERVTCTGYYVAAMSSAGNFYLGTPWFLGSDKGTLEEKVREFTWRALHEHITPILGPQLTRDGLIPITLMQTTERGKIPVEGEIDPAGTVIFLGHFQPMDADVRTVRSKAFAPFLASAPSQGASKAQATVVEFSDFECPSCRHASEYLTPIMTKYGDKVRYVRVDLPLVNMHPWAFSAAVAGRAIHRQKPELFWDYKKRVYEYQEKLSAFTFDDFARGFAEDHGLDMTKYDADVASEAIRQEILKGVGAAFTNDIRGTPTYLVNGAFVDPGKDGKELEEYVAKVVAQ